MFPSRRAPDRVGIVPGRRARRTRPVVLIAIDTSASMTGRDLALVAAEVRTLLRMQVRVVVVQCDVKIQAERWMRPHDDLVRAEGRGGTDLRPPFEATVLRKYRPDLVAYFTDGDGEAPAAKPKGVEVVWVLTDAWAEVPAKWGRVVRMKPMKGTARTARMAR
jgi:predicted metal-dependent peptidase